MDHRHKQFVERQGEPTDSGRTVLPHEEALMLGLQSTPQALANRVCEASASTTIAVLSEPTQPIAADSPPFDGSASSGITSRLCDHGGPPYRNFRLPLTMIRWLVHAIRLKSQITGAPFDGGARAKTGFLPGPLDFFDRSQTDRNRLRSKKSAGPSPNDVSSNSEGPNVAGTKWPDFWPKTGRVPGRSTYREARMAQEANATTACILFSPSRATSSAGRSQ